MDLARRRSAPPEAVTKKITKEIDIVFDDQNDSNYVNSYTSSDKISGQVLIRCKKDSDFHDLCISMDGMAGTYTEKVSSTIPQIIKTEGRKRFLHLSQPVVESSFPEGRVAKAGVLYTFPFDFVVPDRLLEGQCRHGADCPQVREAHEHLPPSIGDPLVAGDGQVLRDDMSPDMARIRYTIAARLVKVPASAHNPAQSLTKMVRLRIVPTSEEDPPLSVNNDNKDYEPRKEKEVKKGLFKTRFGTITAEAPQPSGFRLPALGDRSGSSISTKTTVSLRFDPVSDKDQPPCLGRIKSKLRAETFFGAEPFYCLPGKSSVPAWDPQRGYCTRGVELSSRCLSSVTWDKHEKGDSASIKCEPRLVSDSSQLSCDDIVTNIPTPSSTYQPGNTFYTAKIFVPLALPTKKSMLPTFHSCLISRTYSLDLSISYHSPGPNVTTPSIRLRLPVQIYAEGKPEAVAASLEGESEAMARREVDAELAGGMYFSRTIDPLLRAPEYDAGPSFASHTTGDHARRRARSLEPPSYEARR